MHANAFDDLTSLLLLEVLNVRDDFRAMGIGIDVAVDFGDAAGRINDKAMAARHMDEQERPI